MSYIDLPKEVKDKKAVIKVKNEDQISFMWAIKSALYNYALPKDPQRFSKYKNIGLEIDEALKDISFPVELMNVEKFQRKSNISVNVYSYEIIKEKLNVYILYHTEINRRNVFWLINPK